MEEGGRRVFVCLCDRLVTDCMYIINIYKNFIYMSLQQESTEMNDICINCYVVWIASLTSF